MGGRIKAILLGGTLGPSVLHSALRRPVLCLPMGSRGTVLTQWLDLFARCDSIAHVVAVLNTEHDAKLVADAAGDGWPAQRASHEGDWFRAIGERESWRGPGGILRDVTAEVPSNEIVIVAEAHALSPRSIDPLLERIGRGDVVGVVGLRGSDEPAGVYAFVRSALELAPAIGYFDLKEQFLPALHKAERRVAAATLSGSMQRVRDCGSYVDAVAASLRSEDEQGRCDNRIGATAEISDDAIIDGGCIIGEEVVIESGAVVHQSVVLDGARIGGGAVVSRCVVGSAALVEGKRRVIGEIVADARSVEVSRRAAVAAVGSRRTAALQRSA